MRARVAELQRERDHLVAIVDILQEISASLHFVDILQAIARKLGDAFGLDRCAIFLSGDQNEVRLVASYEDPTIRNLVVDLNRYPELKRAIDSGETVFIPDAANDPTFKSIKGTLDTRNVRSIVLWQRTSRSSLMSYCVARKARLSEARCRRISFPAERAARGNATTDGREATRLLPAGPYVKDAHRSREEPGRWSESSR